MALVLQENIFSWGGSSTGPELVHGGVQYLEKAVPIQDGG